MRCAVAPGVFVYRGAYPVPYAVLAALNERYGPGVWVHATGSNWRRYLASDDPTALAKALTPEYPSEDSKYFPDTAAEMVEFQRRLIETMGIPPEFLGFDEPPSSRAQAEVTQREIEAALKRVQERSR